VVASSDERSEGLARELLAEVSRQDVRLDPEAEELLRLAARAWVRRPPSLRIEGGPGQDLESLARTVLLAALQEPHVRMGAFDAMRIGIGGVRFNDLLYALAVRGRQILRGIADKGF
jgi:hypothetical protein